MNQTKTPDRLEGFNSEGDVNLSSHRAVWNQMHTGGETREWLQKDADVFLHQSMSTPCLNVLEQCDGVYLQDLQGRRILDFHGNSVHQVGYRNPKVVEAIIAQLRTLPFCPRRYTNRPTIELAEKLGQLAPGNLNKVLFAPGGTTAIGMALKLARVATGRFKTISMWDSFHGASLDAISVGGEAVFRNGIGPLLPGAEHVPPPDARHCVWGCDGKCNLKCADYIEYVLEKEGDIAAVIAETVRCTPYIPPKDYWKKVRSACDKHGALLVLDEIPICLGRTGKMFACEHYDVVPDILVIGKGLGGGIFPQAAIIARDSLNVAADKSLGHYTHEKNPVAAAAGLATLECIEADHLLENSHVVGRNALDRMTAMMDRHALIGDVRGLGLLMGMELVTNRKTHARATDAAERILYAALSRGLSFKLTMSNIITLTPPLTISMAEIDLALDILEECLYEVESPR